jgi:hypothetical protein
VSLDYRLTDVADHDDLWVAHHEFPETKVLNPVTECLIFTMMHTGQQKITEKNWQEVAARIAIYERVFQPLMIKGVEGGGVERVPLTAEDVKRHIGLSTNVSQETEAAFRKRVFDNFKREFLYDLSREG